MILRNFSGAAFFVSAFLVLDAPWIVPRHPSGHCIHVSGVGGAHRKRPRQEQGDPQTPPTADMTDFKHCRNERDWRRYCGYFAVFLCEDHGLHRCILEDQTVGSEWYRPLLRPRTEPHSPGLVRHPGRTSWPSYKHTTNATLGKLEITADQGPKQAQASD
jgi:hypothetical protein